MSQPALSELKQRIGFQDGKAGIWMGIDISGFNMPPLGNQIPRRLATQLYIYNIYNMFISHFYDCWRGNVGCQNAGNNCRYRWYSADWDWERYIEWNDDHGNGFLFNNPLGQHFWGSKAAGAHFLWEFTTKCWMFQFIWVHLKPCPQCNCCRHACIILDLFYR